MGLFNNTPKKEIESQELLLLQELKNTLIKKATKALNDGDVTAMAAILDEVDTVHNIMIDVMDLLSGEGKKKYSWDGAVLAANYSIARKDEV